MAGVNKVIIVGNLGKEPEIKSISNGTRVASFSVATSEKWKDRTTGETQERTEWHRIVVWNENIVNVCERFLRKGSKVYLEGQLQTRKWQDQSGQDKYTTEIVLNRFRGELVLLDSRSDAPADAINGIEHAGSTGFSAPMSAVASTSTGQEIVLDDDIPF